MLSLALLLQAAVPSAEAERLGVALAKEGVLAALLPMQAGKEIDEALAKHPEWTAADRASFRRIAAATQAKDGAALTSAIGHQYAMRLGVAEMRALVRFNATPAATHYRAVQPEVIAGTIASIGKIDFMGDTMRAFCAETGKACATK